VQTEVITNKFVGQTLDVTQDFLQLAHPGSGLILSDKKFDALAKNHIHQIKMARALQEVLGGDIFHKMEEKAYKVRNYDFDWKFAGVTFPIEVKDFGQQIKRVDAKLSLASSQSECMLFDISRSESPRDLLLKEFEKRMSNRRRRLLIIFDHGQLVKVIINARKWGLKLPKCER
jgi:hypothetical protein